MAAAMARQRKAQASTRLLEGTVGRRAAGAGVADRSSASTDQDLSRGEPGAASLSGAEPGPEGTQPEVRGDALYDLAGGLQGLAGALQRAGGSAGRIPDRRADAPGDREADRLLHQHAGHAGRSVEEPQPGRVAGASA